MEITPAILATNEADARAKLFHPALQTVPRFHIDVLDGTLFHAHSWADPQIIGSWDMLPEIELHFMVSDPIKHAVQWRRFVKTANRAIIHAESVERKEVVCRQLQAMQFSLSFALSPHVPLDDFAHCKAHADELLIMGIEPGASGRPFLGETILAKIRRAHALFPETQIAVDGGVSKETIHAVSEAGAERFICASAIWKEENPKEALETLARCAILSS